MKLGIEFKLSSLHAVINSDVRVIYDCISQTTTHLGRKLDNSGANFIDNVKGNDLSLDYIRSTHA